ncbi:MAG: UTP--glucose-1-phosphate uridylyltransferase [Chloroflexi bacterium RBG_13_51_52]|nr:MAG: UTP--glucose-1-phosphate uridylyltransferase [Chloroflexi bacterium RBG_13_51_52]
MKVRKAVITAAGWGTRFLPITRSQPKEMLPLIDRPLIQYSVEEAINSGIEQVIMVTSASKRAIEDYFKHSPELENYLAGKGETELLKRMGEISGMADFCYVLQKEPKGLGDAVLMVKAVVGNEPFAVILPDDIIDNGIPALKQMLAIYDKYNAGVVAVERVGDEDIRKYGIIKPKKVEDNVYQVLSLVEKPEPSEAPSRLGIIGRYILTPAIFDILKVTPPGKNGEVQLTDALNTFLKQEKLYAVELEGTRYDAGTPLGWLKANVDLALKREDIAQEFREYLKKLLTSSH